jgi:hypothetical protein
MKARLVTASVCLSLCALMPPLISMLAVAACIRAARWSGSSAGFSQGLASSAEAHTGMNVAPMAMQAANSLRRILMIPPGDRGRTSAHSTAPCSARVTLQ